MTRRSFLTNAGASLAAAALAAPAIAQSQPALRWRMVTSWPRSLDTLYGNCVLLAERVAKLTEGRFQISVHAAGEIVPALGVLDAVQAGTVECGNTAGYFYVGKNKALAFDTALPFGLTTRQQNAWMYYGGGLALMRELYAQYNVINFPAGNTGTQMGGWFRKEIKSLADLRGLKMRIPGLGGFIMAALGVTPQVIAPSDIYPALEKGVIDAAEFVGPHDDEKLGLHNVAKYYYAPAWWEPCAMGSLLINTEAWGKLPSSYQEVLASVCKEVNCDEQAKYDAAEWPALERLLRAGVQLRAFPSDVMAAAQRSANELYDHEAETNPAFKKIYESWRPFREQQFRWFSLNEHVYERFVYANLGAASVAQR